MSPLYWKCVSIFVLIVCVGCSERAERWTDEVALADGKVIEVSRSVRYHPGSGEIHVAMQTWPEQYSLKAKNPFTGNSFEWNGPRKFSPISLDFYQGTPYLVMIADSIFSDLKKYGCPEIPLVFFMFDEKTSQWQQISGDQYPKQILKANLSPSYDEFQMKQAPKQTKELIHAANHWREISGSSYFSKLIPSNFSEWKYQSKNSYRAENRRDGCPSTAPSNADANHPELSGKPSDAGVLEILNGKVHSPVWTVQHRSGNGDKDWGQLTFNSEKHKACSALVYVEGSNTDKPELRGWTLFVKDASKTKKSLGSNTVFCDDSFIWFLSFDPKINRFVFNKYTHGGDLIYRLNFERPPDPDGFRGHMVQSTFRAEKGYLYFDWWFSAQSGDSWQVLNSSQVRVREPTAAK